MNPDGGVLKFGRFELDLARRELRRDGVPVELQRAPLRLLLYLAEHRDRAVPKEELLEKLWHESLVTDSSVSNALSQLRIAVEDDGRSQRVIRTGRGRGYRFVAVAPALATPNATRRRRNQSLGGIAALMLLAGLAAWWLARDPALPPIRSVAVLPLENLSGDPDQGYVADGMTDALIGELAKIASVRVISRPSVMRYRGSAKSVPEIATELGVEALIVGSVVREDERIRINLQLVDGRSDTHLWSKSYERDLHSVLALQGEVAGAVAAQIRVELTPEERALLTNARTVAPDAYMRAMQLFEASDLTGIETWGPTAIEHVERAVELDPGFAEAWVALGRAHLNMSLRDFSARDAEERARDAAQRALQLDDSLGRAHTLLGGVRRFYDWDLAGAGRAYERAVELSPNDPVALNFYANYLGEVEGRTEEALALSARSKRSRDSPGSLFPVVSRVVRERVLSGRSVRPRPRAVRTGARAGLRLSQRSRAVLLCRARTARLSVRDLACGSRPGSEAVPDPGGARARLVRWWLAGCRPRLGRGSETETRCPPPPSLP